MRILQQLLRRYAAIVCLGILLFASLTPARGSQPVFLQSGPISLKFQDGELRYLFVGNKEIVRRVYFAVRDSTWNTAMPQFTKVNVQPQQNGFTIDLSANCHTSLADYSWTGHIVGTTQGKITFTVSGAANSDFQSQRIGLCVLYGAPSLAGQTFATLDSAGTATSGTFPLLVSPTLVAGNFQTLRYTADSGMQVSGSISGTHFDMEDQRNYGDSSFKAYATLPYAYPNISKGDTKSETFTLQVQNPPVIPPPSTNVYVQLGNLIKNSAVAKIVPFNSSIQPIDFVSINGNRTGNTGASTLTWGYNPAVHLPDDDVFLENVPTIVYQAMTARSFAPHAAIHIAPIRPDYTPQLPNQAPRSGEVIGGAWSAALLKYMSLAGVTNISFEEGPGMAKLVQEEIAQHTGQPLYDTHIDCTGFVPVDALAIDDNGQRIIWLINLTPTPLRVTLNHLVSASQCELHRYNSTADVRSGPTLEAATVHATQLPLILVPYEVCEVRISKN